MVFILSEINVFTEFEMPLLNGVYHRLCCLLSNLISIEWILNKIKSKTIESLM